MFRNYDTEMSPTPETDIYYDYQCEFRQHGKVIPGTSLHLSRINLKFNTCFLTLEVADWSNCGHYPKAPPNGPNKMRWSNIIIKSLVGRTRNSQQTVVWQEENPSPGQLALSPLSCGEHVQVVDNMADVTTVDLYFN